MDNKIPKYKSWVNLVAISAFCSPPPFGFLMGIFALFGFNTVHYIGEPVVGIQGLITGIVGGIFLAGLITGFAATFGFFGLIIYSKFRPITLDYKQ
jgi:hypothetical protein